MATDIVDVSNIKQEASQVLSNLHQNLGYGPGYISGNYYPGTGYLNCFGSISSAAFGSAGLVTYTPFICANEATFTTISCFIVVGVAASTINMAIYANSNGQPTGTPLTGTTSGQLASTSSSTQLSFTLSTPLLLEAGGVVWLAVMGSTITTLTIAVTSGALFNINGTGQQNPLTGAPNTNNIPSYQQTNTYANGFPTVASLARGPTSTPLVFLKAQ